MSDLDLFRRESDIIELQPEEILFSHGDEANAAYVITSGTVEIIVNNEVIDVVGEGDIVGEMALIDDGVRSATVRAKTIAHLARIDQKRFIFLIQQTPYFALSVMRTMSERIRKMHER